MHRNLALVSSLAAIVSAAGAMGCSSSSGSSASTSSTTGGGSQGGCTSQTVIFSKDVAPAFIAAGCSLASVCHGQPNNGGEEDLFLGDNDGSTDPKMTYAQLVGVLSKEDPPMNLVTASSTANSYLWHKIDGDQNSNSAVSCANQVSECSNCNTTTPCGAAMPDTGMALIIQEPNNFCIIQNWIEEGAPNN